MGEKGGMERGAMGATAVVVMECVVGGGEGEEGGKLRRSRSIGQGRREGSLNGVQWRGDDTSAS